MKNIHPCVKSMFYFFSHVLFFLFQFLQFLSSGLEASIPTLVGWSVCLSVRLSLEKMSKIVKNNSFGLHEKTKVIDHLD